MEDGLFSEEAPHLLIHDNESFSIWGGQTPISRMAFAELGVRAVGPGFGECVHITRRDFITRGRYSDSEFRVFARLPFLDTLFSILSSVVPSFLFFPSFFSGSLYSLWNSSILLGYFALKKFFLG